MTDKNEAREWLIAQGVDMTRMLQIAPDKIVHWLTAYTASLTQERDALRATVQIAYDISLNLYDEDNLCEVCHIPRKQPHVEWCKVGIFERAAEREALAQKVEQP